MMFRSLVPLVMPKVRSTEVTWNPNLQEHLENPEHDQARHEGIHGYGRGETC